MIKLIKQVDIACGVLARIPDDGVVDNGDAIEVMRQIPDESIFGCNSLQTTKFPKSLALQDYLQR